MSPVWFLWPRRARLRLKTQPAMQITERTSVRLFVRQRLQSSTPPAPENYKTPRAGPGAAPRTRAPRDILARRGKSRQTAAPPRPANGEITKNARRCCKHHGASATILSVPLPTHSRALAARVDQYQQCTGANIELAPYEVQFGRGVWGLRRTLRIGVGALEDSV